MDAYDRCINLGEKILLIVLPSMVEAKNFSGHPHMKWFDGKARREEMAWKTRR
jgi:hypothetical protein